MTDHPFMRCARIVAALAVFVVTCAGVVASATGGSAGTLSPRTPEPLLLSRAGTSNVVYVLAEQQCRHSTCASLYRTDIDATSFTRVSAPPVKVGAGTFPTSTLEKLVFANRRDGYALVAYDNFGVSLYVTSNGARTWRLAARTKEGEMTLLVSSSRVLLATVHCKPRTMNCAQWVTRRSSLDARHWSRLPRLWRTGTSDGDVFYGPSLAAYGDRVWELETGPEIDLWTSNNGGRTFMRRVEPQLGSVAGCTFTTMSAASLWAECPTGMQAAFVHSSDGGLHWTNVRQSQFFGTGGGAFAPVSTNVAYLDYGQGSGPYNLFRLTDGGRRARAVANVRCASVPSMIFTNATRGVMLCDVNATSIRLRRTDDGGVSWSTVRVPIT
jgi:hypothetical protein